MPTSSTTCILPFLSRMLIWRESYRPRSMACCTAIRPASPPPCWASALLLRIHFFLLDCLL
eukprot:10390980-Lingulodinium_polyedra.AAC.1